MDKRKVHLLTLSIVGLLLVGCTPSGSVSSSRKGRRTGQTTVTVDSTSNTVTIVTSDTDIPSTKSTAPTTSPSNSTLTSVPEDHDEYVAWYYSSINETMSGDTLKNKLYDIIHPGKATSTYDAIWSNYLLYSDVAHPENSGKASDDIMAFYRGTIASRSQMNKEHVWPKSRGGDYIEGDPHMVRPTLISDNSSRGNSFYVEGKATEHDGWDPKADGMEETYRGDCARIIFYCAVQEKDYLTLIDKETDNQNNHTMGKLSDLLRWNLNYPVQQREINRNEILNGQMTSYGKTYKLNRNPFIDHPEYACRIWGNTNATTKGICGL